MTRRISPIALCAMFATLVSAAVSFAAPAGKTTLEETIKFKSGNGFGSLVQGKGEAILVRKNLAKPKKGRELTRKTIINFGHMTDPQVADEMSPARGELVDPAGNPFASGWRPQEALNLQSYEQLVRNVNANRTSPIAQAGGKHAKMAMVLNTGDMADSMQLNEARWYIDLLEGGQIDPFSGVPATPSNCTQPGKEVTAEQLAALNADVAARRYTGIQDFSDWPGAPANRYTPFWDPDETAAGGPYVNWPRYAGLMDRAQKAFNAQGLKAPWYTSRGNHDVLWQGTFPPIAAATVLTTACYKPYPNAELDPARYEDHPERLVADLGNGPFVSKQLELAKLVPPDPDRRFMVPGEYKELHGNADNGHGYKFVSSAENKASNGAAPYYGFTRKGVRFLAIDTNAEGGSAEGNVDNPQYKWIEKELKAAKRKKQLVVGFSHHPLSSQNAEVADEERDPCGASPTAGCDLDPRSSTPIHRGLTGPKPLRDLLLKYPNFIAYVVGHIHENRITPYKKGKGGFWEISTASEIDWPQQARLIDLMNNGDGTLSIFGTVVDSAAPLTVPASGSNASVFTDVQLASLSRLFSVNDPQTGITGSESKHAEGKRADRNVELVVNDPR